MLKGLTRIHPEMQFLTQTRYTTSFTQNEFLKTKIWLLKKLKAIVTCSDQTEIRIIHCDLHPDVNFNIWINMRKDNLIYCQVKQIKSLRKQKQIKPAHFFLLPSFLRLNSTLWTPILSASPCPKQHRAKWNMGVAVGLQQLLSVAPSWVLSTGCSPSACSGTVPLHALQFLQKNLYLLWHVIFYGLQGKHLLQHLKQFLPLLLWPGCSEGCFTFLLTAFCHAAFCPFLQTPPQRWHLHRCAQLCPVVRPLQSCLEPAVSCTGPPTPGHLSSIQKHKQKLNIKNFLAISCALFQVVPKVSFVGTQWDRPTDWSGFTAITLHW